ncbi:MAG: hypothetical protein ACTSYD_10275 [Candidatus Heimdallarchaeaceae archaeon]
MSMKRRNIRNSWFFLSKRRATPILEEVLLVGIAIFIFAIIFGIILNLIDWSQTTIGDVFK